MTEQEAYEELDAMFPRSEGYIDFDRGGRVLIDGTVTIDELRKILELFERLHVVPAIRGVT